MAGKGVGGWGQGACCRLERGHSHFFLRALDPPPQTGKHQPHRESSGGSKLLSPALEWYEALHSLLMGEGCSRIRRNLLACHLFSCLVMSDSLQLHEHQASLVLHHLLEFAQIHVRWVDVAICPSHPLLRPSPAFKLSPPSCLFRSSTSGNW